MATFHTQSSCNTPNPRSIATSAHAHGVLAINPSHHKHEVITFLQNRLISERRDLESERDHQAHSAGRLFDLTTIHIALLENDISQTEKLLQGVVS